MGCVCAKSNLPKHEDDPNYDKSPFHHSHGTLSTVIEPIDISFDIRNSRVQKFHTDNIVADCPVSQPDFKIAHFSNEFEAEHVAAGWPSWLVSVAGGEVVKGWLPRKFSSFEKLNKIGQGTYSSVYKGRDLKNGMIVALKKVRFVNMDPQSVQFMAREIHILRKLDHPNIIKLEGLITSRTSSSLYLVFEYMEHDLAGLSVNPNFKFTEPQIKCYMKQLLCGLEHCHSRGVMHRDIKGANLLIDNNGALRIADFGLATIFNSNHRQPLTSRVVTLWYRPPELLLGATEYKPTVDLWSCGCILGELLSGKPILPGRTEVEQLHKIFKLCGSPSEEYWKRSKLPNATIFKPQQSYQRCILQTFSDLPSSALELLNVLLSIEPEQRGTPSSALNSDFFTTKPFPSHPSALPKYPPSKEFNIKLKGEEFKRKKDASMKKKNLEIISNEENGLQQQERRIISNPRSASISNYFNSRFIVESSERKPLDHVSHSGPFIYHGSSFNSNSTCDNQIKKSIWKNYESRFMHLDDIKVSENHKRINSCREHRLEHGIKQNRMHYSGPLLHPNGNLEDMLKNHENNIQQAVRKIRFEKGKSRKNSGQY